MKNLTVVSGESVMVTWQNKDGHYITLPLVRTGKEWKHIGSYIKRGLSSSDPTYGAVFALPHNWKIPSKILKKVNREHV